MSLEEKLNHIDLPRIATLPNGIVGSLDDFWNVFVAPKLPSKDVMQKWYDILLRYIDDEDSVFAIRCFGDRVRGEDDTVLRRGFYTKTNAGYSFFYTDNFFAAYFAKMSLDGFCPQYDEFKRMFLERKFPARFAPWFSCKEERSRAAFSLAGIDPQIHGYKIAHIFDCGQNFWYDNQYVGIKEICRKYFPRGDYRDWVMSRDEQGEFYVRELKDIAAEAKDLLKAHYLRFICPLNYVFTPAPSKHSTNPRVYRNDIAEWPNFQRFARNKFFELYGELYHNFVTLIMVKPEDLTSEIGSTEVEIQYGLTVVRNQDNVEETSNEPSSVNAVPHLGAGKFAKSTFTRLLKEDLLSDVEIDLLRDKQYCFQTFRISWPILVNIQQDSFDSSRYYKEVVKDNYRICSQWYDRNIPFIEDWIEENFN